MRGGAISGVIRFICHLPLGFYCVNAMKHWQLVKQHASLLLAPPLSHKIQVGEQFAGPWGAFAFAWNFVMWIPTSTAPDELLLYMGLVDALIVMALIVATSIEGTYVGKTTNQCAQVSQNRTTDQSLIFFDRAGAINMTDIDYGKDLCNDFLQTFYTGIAVIIMYIVSALSNITIGALSWRDKPVRYNRSHITWRRDSLRSIITSPLALLRDILMGISSCVLACLPKRMQQPIRFSGRFASKWGRAKTTTAQLSLRQLPRHLHPGLHKSTGADRALETIFLYDILVLIAPKLHYVDLVNLSMVSKRVRAAMFPVSEAHDKERELRLYSCYGNVKSVCWICDIQICNACSNTKKCPDTKVSAHMQLCQTQCSKCFYSEINRLSRPCGCYDARTADRQRYYSYNRDANSLKDRLLCRDCFRLKDEDRQALREKRDRVTYTNLTRQPLACAQCKEALRPSGPLWWVCSKCSVECRSHDHPGWRRKLEI